MLEIPSSGGEIIDKNAIASGITPASRSAMIAVHRMLDAKTKPRGSLGRLEHLAIQMAGACHSQNPCLERGMVVVMGADHGITKQKVSAYPRSVTKAMMGSFVRGKAGINVLAQHQRIPVIVVNMGIAEDLSLSPSSSLIHCPIAYGTKDFSQGPAMTSSQCTQALSRGRDLADKLHQDGMQLVGLGDMGIGNTTCASALACALLKKNAIDMTGYGTGLNHQEYEHKIDVIQQALERHRKSITDPHDALVALGGFEIAALCGLTLGCAAHHIPVVMDGFPTTVASLCATMMEPSVKDYLVAGHQSEEKGHAIVLKSMNLKPLLHLGMRLGEGTGAVLAMNLVMASVALIQKMGTFQEEEIPDTGR